jgi:hypothetical protein
MGLPANRFAWNAVVVEVQLGLSARVENVRSFNARIHFTAAAIALFTANSISNSEVNL